MFKAVCGLLSLNSGEILTDGKKRQPDILRSAGIIIEEPAFLRNYTGMQNLEYLYMINHKNDRMYLKHVMGLCPNAEEIYKGIMSIPLYPKMTDQDVEDVIHAVTKIVDKYKC